LYTSRQRVAILYNGSLLSPLNCPFPRGYRPPYNTRFLRPTRVHSPNGISTGSAVFARLTFVTDRQTDHATPSVTIGRIYVVTGMLPNNNTHANVNGSVIMTRAIARVIRIQPIHLINAAANQPSNQANRLRLQVRLQADDVHIRNRHLVLLVGQTALSHGQQKAKSI